MALMYRITKHGNGFVVIHSSGARIRRPIVVKRFVSRELAEEFIRKHNLNGVDLK